MHTKANSEDLAKSKDMIYISILLTLAFCVGVYLIITTVLIAKDGVTLIEYARNLMSDPKSTMLSEAQHPGYPFLILAGHQIAKRVSDGSSLFSWIYAAQVMALTFRLLAIIIIYFIGKALVGGRFSFWATLILILLPLPAKFGSDTLGDWPYIFCLSAGLLLLIRGAIKRRWWLFGVAGIFGGLGYLIRPECAQLVVYGSLWLILQLFWPKHMLSRGKAVLALALLLIGFWGSAYPYMHLKGAVFPKKHAAEFVSNTQCETAYQSPQQALRLAVYDTDTIYAFGKLFQNIGELLVWFFVPALFVGLACRLKKGTWHEPTQFFMIILIAMNVLLMMWLHSEYGYMSKRHTLPLVIFTVFYIPPGLQSIALFLQNKTGKKCKASATMNEGPKQYLFFVFLAIGISVCLPKLLRPIRTEKALYRTAAQWLNNHSRPQDLIATPDLRISFYAGRRGWKSKGSDLAGNAEYAVIIHKAGNGLGGLGLPHGLREVFTESDNSSALVICQRL